MPDSLSIQDAVNAAAAEHGIAPDSNEEIIDTGKSEETKVEEKVEEKAEETSEESEESQQLDERTTKALQLFDMLEDTEKGPELVREMARRMGLIENAKTPEKAEKAADSLTEKILAELGEDYPILANKLAEVIGDALHQQETKFAKEINSREMARYTDEINRRAETFIKENKVTEAEQLAINKLAGKFPPAPSVPPEEYLAHHLKTIRLEQAEKVRNGKVKDKIKSNLAERPASRGVAANEERVVKPTSKLTPLQAVQMAARGETVSE